jgi:hypothetical protein
MTDKNIDFEALLIRHFQEYVASNPDVEDFVLTEDDISRIAKSIWQNRFDENVIEFGDVLVKILQNRIS